MHFSISKPYPNIYALAEWWCQDEIVHSYLIVGDEYGILWDTGMGVLDMKKMVQQITDKPIAVVNSHMHYDHIGSNHQFDTVWNYEHPICAETSNKGVAYKDFVVPPFGYTRILAAHEKIYCSPFVFEVIPTPGHSSDSISLYEPSLGWLFCGDLLYDGPIYIDDPKTYVSTIETLQKKKIRAIFPGHNQDHMDLGLYDSLCREAKKILQSEKVQITNKCALVRKE